MIEMFVAEYPDNTNNETEAPFFTSYSCRAFEAMRSDLIKLGLAAGTPQKSALLVKKSEVRDVLISGQPELSIPFARLLNDWLYVFTSYHDDALPTTRHPFNVTERYRDIVEMFEGLGYVTKTHHQYIWTDKIAAAMQSFYQWDDTLKDVGETLSAKV